MRKDEKIVLAKEAGWNRRDEIAKKREEDLVAQSYKDVQLATSERTKLINAHFKEIEILKETHIKEMFTEKEAHRRDLLIAKENYLQDVAALKKNQLQILAEEKALYEKEVKELKYQVDEKKKDLDRVKRTLENRTAKADDILEKLKKLALNLHIRQRESIEVLKEFNIQANKLNRHGDALEHITKYTDKLEKEFKLLKSE
jgi:hypothetical protein